MQEKFYDISYQGRKIYRNLTIEDCSEILQDFSERYNDGEKIDLSLIQMEEILNG